MAIQRADEGISARQAAERVGVAESTMYSWIKKGLVPVTRFGPTGRIVRIDPKDLDALRRTS